MNQQPAQQGPCLTLGDLKEAARKLKAVRKRRINNEKMESDLIEAYCKKFNITADGIDLNSTSWSVMNGICEAIGQIIVNELPELTVGDPVWIK